MPDYLFHSFYTLSTTGNRTGSVFVMNLFLGWTFIGWIWAFIWAITPERKREQIIVNNHISSDTSPQQPKWLTLFRIILGLILFWKGISFIHDSTILEEMVQRTGINMFGRNAELIVFIVPYLNLLCGLFIAVGLFTRWASIIQLPIMIVAVIFINVKSGMAFDMYELILSVIVLILLIVFVIKGSGVISADEYFHSYYKAAVEPGNTKKILE